MDDSNAASDALGQPSLFHFEEGRPSFDDLAQANGFLFWSARRLMELLEYSSWDSFFRVVNKALGACLIIGAEVAENFEKVTVVIGGKPQVDYKLSRFACYLVAMNADPKKRAVAIAQGYFAAIAVQFQKAIQSPEDVARVETRDEISRHERTLSGAAQERGVTNFAFFRDQGYRGLYNMSLAELKRHKGFDGASGRPLLDFMGQSELAANLFRITVTEDRIRLNDVKGQAELERTAHSVGREVRAVMTRDGGTAPENLPLAPDIKKVAGDLKRTAKGLKAADDGKRRDAKP